MDRHTDVSSLHVTITFTDWSENIKVCNQYYLSKKNLFTEFKIKQN